MSTIRWHQCGGCRERKPVRLDTDGGGQLVEVRDPCACERMPGRVIANQPRQGPERRAKAARLTGLCMDCDEGVEGTPGKALRCALHKRQARRAAESASRKRPEAAERRRQTERSYYARPDVKARVYARKRELHRQRMETDEVYADKYKKRRQAEHLLTYHGRERYMETQRRHNADPGRQARKRELALAAYYEAHPERPAPTCATCTKPIEWEGRGRPPKYHKDPACNPHVARRLTSARG